MIFLRADTTSPQDSFSKGRAFALGLCTIGLADNWDAYRESWGRIRDHRVDAAGKRDSFWSVGLRKSAVAIFQKNF